MDYKALAERFGGSSSEEPTSLDELAKKYGGAPVTTPPSRPAATKPVITPVTQQPVVAARPSPIVSQPTTRIMEPVEPVIDYGEAATGMMSPAPSTQYTMEQVVENPQEFSVVQRFMKERYPNKELPKDPLQLVSEFRKSQAKTDFGLANELSWALNATPKQKEIARDAYALADKLGSDLGAEVLASIQSPSTYVGGIAGWATKQAALRGVKTGIKTALLPVAVTSGVEASAQGSLEAVSQATKVALGLQEEVNYAQVGLRAGLGAVIGGAEAIPIGAAPLKTTKERFASLVQRKKTEAGETLDKPTVDFLKQFTQREKQVAPNDRALFADSLLRKATREPTLDKMDQPEAVTEAVLSEKVVTDMFKVAKQIYKDNPLLRPDLKEVRITQAVINTLSDTDPDVLQQAVKRAGVDSKDFLDAFKVTLSQAGATLQEASSLARFLNNMSKGDPELEKALNRMARASQGTSYISGNVLEGTSTGVRMSVAASTAGLSTAVMNAIGLSGSVPLKIATDTVDAVGTTLGRIINDMRGGSVTPWKARVKEHVSEGLADSTFVLSRLVDGGYSTEIADLLLKDQPRINNLFSSIGAETDNRGLPQLMNTINVFNRAVDSVVRKPILIQSVRDRMKAIGLDYEDYLVNNKPIPVSLLRSAVDDALKLTFSYNFKRTGEKSFEGVTENAAAYLLEQVNRNAGASIIGNVALPFMRFMFNSMRYTYRMTPISSVASVQEIRQARKFLDEGKLEEAAGLMYDARKKAIDSFVGTAAIGAGVAYRMENSDIEFWQAKDDEGNVKDLSSAFPFVNVMAMAEATLLMKDMSQNLWYTLAMSPEERAEEAKKFRDQAKSVALNEKGKQALIMKAEQLELNRVRKFDGQKFTEIMTGMGRSSVSQNTVFDQAARLVEGGITENLERKAGTAVGDFLGRFDNFFNPVFDLANFIREDFRVVDTRAPTETDIGEKFSPAVDAAVASLAGPVPFARDILQEKPSLFQQEPQQVPTVLRQVQGIRPTPPTSRIENELARLRIPSFSVFKSTGDRTLDNITMKTAQPVFQQKVEELIFQDPNYQKLSINGQRAAIKTRMSEALNAVSTQVREEYLATQPARSVNTMYDKLSREKKEAAEDLFMQLYKRRPTSLEDKLRIIQGEFDIAEAVGKFAYGGLAQQTEKMLGR